ncbi:hypothetical protein ABW19_dt0206072 [Dactylella cylindrospora]|nr:hypothetical protein ABW19_dt0206072 [Dactylella cylindrospora]
MSSPLPSDGSPFPTGKFLPNGNRNDPPLPPNDPTIGFKLNHLMLRIRDPIASLRFYIDLMGMRTVFTMDTGPFTIYYLGYPQTPADRSDIPAWADRTCANLPHTLGLLELYHIHGSEKQQEGYYTTGNDAPNIGFGQVGFTVPDVAAALERLRSAGVRILKELGVATRESIPLSQWEEERGVGVGEVHAGYRKILEQIAFVADPVSLNSLCKRESRHYNR